MRTRDFLFIAAPLVATSLLIAGAASADELKPGSGNAGQITAIQESVSELSLEQLFTFAYDKRGDTESFRMTLLTGPTFRYFVAKNAPLGVNAAFLYKQENGQVKNEDLGGALTIHIGYMLNLSGGVFLKPLVGAGGFYGQRKQHVMVGTTDTVVTSQLYGGVFRGGIPLFFYSSSRFNLFAGPEMILTVGGSSDVTVSGTKVKGDNILSVDGGLSAGLSYVF